MLCSPELHCPLSKLGMLAGTATGSLIHTCCLSAPFLPPEEGEAVSPHGNMCEASVASLPIQCKVQGNDDQSQGACLMHISKLGRAARAGIMTS